MTEQPFLPGIPEPHTAPPEMLRGIVGLIAPHELAKALNLAEQTLAGWRSSGQGPAYVKLGKGVFYRLADVQAWVARNVTEAVVGGKPAE